MIQRIGSRLYRDYLVEI